MTLFQLFSIDYAIENDLSFILLITTSFAINIPKL